VARLTAFSVLGAHGHEGEAWRALIERLPAAVRDLHYLPEYGLVYRDAYGHEPLLAVYEGASGLVLQAFVRRPLACLDFLAEVADADRFQDIATPYGYGGPLLACPDAPGADDDLRRFDAAFRDWCVQSGIASEFTCLHPLLGNHRAIERAGIAAPVRTKEVVYIDLAHSEDALWSSISRGTRSSIQRARREGVRVEAVTPDAAALTAFGALYADTMRRRGAAARWFFPENYFEACVRRLGPARSRLFFARRDGALAAAYLVLNDESTAWYHFGGSDANWLALRPNNLLMHETLAWARRHGLARYHLGGGVTGEPNDSLLRFKSSFGGQRAVLYTYGRVHDEAAYRVLSELKIAHERRVHGVPVASDYFPLYRREPPR